MPLSHYVIPKCVVFCIFVVSPSVNKQSSWQPVLYSGLRHHTHDRIELEGLLWIIHPYLLHVIPHALVEGDVCCLIRHKVVDGVRWPLVSTKVAETHYVVNIAYDEREIAFDSASAFVLLNVTVFISRFPILTQQWTFYLSNDWHLKQK